MNIIAPSVSPRLEFFVTDSTGAAVTSLADTDVTSAAYVLITAGVRAAAVTVTLTSSVAATAAISAQQFVTINSARGHYAVDCPAGAALSTADSVELAIVMDDGAQLVFPVSHEIRQPAVLDTATQTKIDTQYAVTVVATGTVGATTSTTSFYTDLAGADNYWRDQQIVFLTGNLTGVSIPIQSFTDTNGVVSPGEAMISAPDAGSTFAVVARHTHTVQSIQDGLARQDELLDTHSDVNTNGTAIAALENLSAAQVTSAVPTTSQIAAAVDVALINTGDGSDLLQAIANQIAADWVAGDASPLAIIAAMKNDATIAQMIARIDDAMTTRASQTSVNVIDGIVDAIVINTGTDIPAQITAEAVKTTAIQSSLTTITNRIGAWTGSGINTILGAFRAITAKAALLTPTDLSTDTGFLNTTDSLEAIRDRGDAAWTGSGGGSGAESDLMVSTTIATVTSQTVFVLTDGSADDDAYNDQLVVITDASTSTQKSRGIVSDYVGATKTVTLRAAPGFTIATGDGVAIIAIGSDVSSTQLAGAVSSAVAIAGVTTTVTGIPTFLRVGDARTVANGGAIAVRLYDADDDSLLFGLGTQLFEDATITFSLRRGGNDGTEGTEDAVIPCTWVASGGDGYVQIAYEGDALDDCDAMDKLKEKDCHRWGIKFQWGDDDPITPVYGTLSVLRKIVSTQ